MINKAAIVLKYTQEAVDWINRADPHQDDPGISIEHVNDDRTVYLIRDEDADDPRCLDRWIKGNYLTVFERELKSWYSDPVLWPSDLSLNAFKRWFTIELHTIIEDTVGAEIIDEDAEPGAAPDSFGADEL